MATARAADEIGQRRPGELRQLRVLSYNIQAGTAIRRYREYVTHGWKQVLPHTERVENLDAIAQLMSEYDLVGLQEADAGSLRSGFINQTKYLAEHAQFPYWSHQPNRRLANIVHAGNGMLSRMQPTEITEHRLPGAIPGRGAMWARFGEEPGALIVVVLHLALGRRARLTQLNYVSELLDGHRHTVVMGDMNCPLGSREMDDFFASTGLREPLDDLHTFPSWRPHRSLDHILVSPSLEVERFEVLDCNYSDHLPVSMTLRLPSEVHLTAG